MASQTPVEIVTTAVSRWLELGDDLLPIVVLVTVVANRLKGSQPVWTMIVAPPSSGKSALIQAADEIKGVQKLGKLTGRTLVSGVPGREYSLLIRMKQQGKFLMTHKDWGTILTLSPNERSEILGQLREIYDGKFQANYGTGVSVDWRGKLGFLVGATPAVDKIQKGISELGERFVQFRPDAPDPLLVTARASKNRGREQQMDREIASAYIRAFVHAMNIARSQPKQSDVGDRLAGALARLVAVARTPVSRDRFTGGFQVSDPEGPARLTGVFTLLYRAAYTCYGCDHKAAARLVIRVGIDSITPGIRRKLISMLAGSEWGISAKGLGQALLCDDNTARRGLDDLVALGLADADKPLKATVYTASDRLRSLASEVYSDEFEPDEALQKLSLLHNNLLQEGKRKERE